MIVVLLLLSLTAQSIVPLSIFVFLLRAVSQATTPTIQARIMGVAEDNQAIAGALNHSALNLGHILGAILGGVVIALGAGFAATARASDHLLLAESSGGTVDSPPWETVGSPPWETSRR